MDSEIDMAATTKKLTIVVGCDDAGLQYKDTLKADLEKDSRVERVIDVGITGDDKTAYPHIAVDAARKIASGEADRALLICGTGEWVKGGGTGATVVPLRH